MIACTFMRLCRPWQGATAFANIAWTLPHYCNFFTIAQQLRFVQVCPYTNCHTATTTSAMVNIDAHNSL
ncbi:hypothetical protein FPI77_17680 [Klebsiella quasivariicola]|nr:hypothetical protein [Klebsiella quasivariicola]NBZ74021.1 hypothetical protein [Klebsiella quasivariicola]QBL48873.1 hypothetical protein BMD99_010195 [Klebsiella sp. PO552]TTM69698.1 hypothetical protein FPI77_17680 [Klebsiella quasivariicola]